MNNPSDILLSPSPRPPPPPTTPPATTTISQDSSLSTCTKSPDAEHSPSHHLPHSVKGAPAHLRTTIRKRQNSESAKRSRLRRKEAARRFYERFNQQCQRIRALETRVAQMSAMLSSDDDERDANNHNRSTLGEDDKQTNVVPTRAPVAPLVINSEEAEAQRQNELKAFEADLDELLDSCVQAEVYEEEGIYTHRALW